MPQEYLRSPSLALLSSKFLRVPLIQVDICVPINQLSIAEAGCCIGNLLAQALCPNLYNQFSRSIRMTQLEYPLQSMVQCRREWVAEAQLERNSAMMAIYLSNEKAGTVLSNSHTMELAHVAPTRTS